MATWQYCVNSEYQCVCDLWCAIASTHTQSGHTLTLTERQTLTMSLIHLLCTHKHSDTFSDTQSQTCDTHGDTFRHTQGQTVLYRHTNTYRHIKTHRHLETLRDTFTGCETQYLKIENMKWLQLACRARMQTTNKIINQAGPTILPSSLSQPDWGTQRSEVSHLHGAHHW